jgi:hypothetical protein
MGYGYNKDGEFSFAPFATKQSFEEKAERPGIVLFTAFKALVSLFLDHVTMFIYFLAAPATTN